MSDIPNLPNSVETKQIEALVNEVLQELMSQQLAKNTETKNEKLKPAGQERISQERPPLRLGSRQLADENLARWLGNTPRNASQPTSGLALRHIPARSNRDDKTIRKFSAALDENTREVRNSEELKKIRAITPARIGIGRTGTRYLTDTMLKFRADHAIAKDAVIAEFKPGFAEANNWIPLETQAKDKEEFLLRPDLGRVLSESSLKIIQEKGIKNPDIQIIVADGLSAWAAERYAKPMTDELIRLFTRTGMSVGTIFCVRYSRIAIQDVIGEAVGAKVSMILLGERPGLGTGDSLSNYMIYGPKVGAVNAKKSMISNIHPAGTQPIQAAQLTFDMVKKMFEQGCSGIELKI